MGRSYVQPGIEDVAFVLGVARSTVTQDWRMARAWLRAELSGAKGADDP